MTLPAATVENPAVENPPVLISLSTGRLDCAPCIGQGGAFPAMAGHEAREVSVRSGANGLWRRTSDDGTAE